MKNLFKMRFAAVVVACIAFSAAASAQKYSGGLVDKTVAVVGNEVIMISDIEEEVKMQAMGGYMSDKTGRCEMLEQMMVAKLFLMQARVDSLEVNNDMVESNLSDRMDRVMSYYGGTEGVEKEFGKSVYKLRQEWKQILEEQTLTQQMQQEVAKKVPELTPYDVEQYIASVDKEDLPMVPIKYQLRQISGQRGCKSCGEGASSRHT